MEKEKVYCKDCRFLRQPIEEENRFGCSFFGNEVQIFLCAAPKNLIRHSNFMGWELGHEQHPIYKNNKNNCPDFETIEQAITQK